MLLADLYLLNHYFDEAFCCMDLAEMIQRYGQDEVRAAIKNGDIKLRQYPCRRAGKDLGMRALCKLSPYGAQKAAHLAQNSPAQNSLAPESLMESEGAQLAQGCLDLPLNKGCLDQSVKGDGLVLL